MLKFIKENIYFIIGLLISVSVLWPLAKPGYFSHHDDVQVIRLFEMDKCVKDFQFPCRWVPDLGGGYGYPIFNYYAPTPYYIGELFYLVSGNFLIAAKLMFAASLIGSYVFMYLLGKSLWGKAGGALSGVFYSLVPYHAVNLYVRGAMGELFAMAFIPLIFYYLIILSEKSNIKNSLKLSIALALLITSHNLSFIIFSPTILLFFIILYFRNKSLRFWKMFLLSIFSGLTISAFYWLPAVTEGKYVHLETMTVGYFSYTEHFKGLKKLFIDRTWSWGPSIREVPNGEKDQMPYQIGWIHLFMFTISFVSLWFFSDKSKRLFYRILCLGVSIIVLTSIFMIHPRSVYVWDTIRPILKYLQFPWRFLIVISFFVSLVSGGVFVIAKKFSWLLFTLVLIFVVVFNYSYFRPEKFLNVTQEDYLSGQTWDKQIKRSIFDYLPIFATMPPAELSTKNYEIVSGEAKIDNFNKGTDWIKFEVEALDPTTIRLSQYYFPGWKTFVNGENSEIKYDNYLGLMDVTFSPGRYFLEAKLTNTLVRNIGNFISLAAIVTVIWFSIYQKSRKIHE